MARALGDVDDCLGEVGWVEDMMQLATHTNRAQEAAPASLLVQFTVTVEQYKQHWPQRTGQGV